MVPLLLFWCKLEKLTYKFYLIECWIEGSWSMKERWGGYLFTLWRTLDTFLTSNRRNWSSSFIRLIGIVGYKLQITSRAIAAGVHDILPFHPLKVLCKEQDYWFGFSVDLWMVYNIFNIFDASIFLLAIYTVYENLLRLLERLEDGGFGVSV